MSNLAQGLAPGLDLPVLPLSRETSFGSSTGDEVGSFDALPLVYSHTHTIETLARPDFYIFTSLLWTRRSDQDPIPACQNKTGSNGRTVLDITQPDLGLLRFHRDRLADAAEAIQWRNMRALERSENGLYILRSTIVIYLRCLPPLPPGTMEHRKIKLMVDKHGAVQINSTVLGCLHAADASSQLAGFLPMTLDLTPGTEASLPPINTQTAGRGLAQVFLDSRPSGPSLFTTHKTSQRWLYNQARTRANIITSAPTEKEVLIYNRNREIMEASLCTVYFLRNGKWITPAAICGGNLGVTRRLALDNGLCKQGTVEITEIEDGEKIWLSNAARGFFVGQISLHEKAPPSEHKSIVDP